MEDSSFSFSTLSRLFPTGRSAMIPIVRVKISKWSTLISKVKITCSFEHHDHNGIEPRHDLLHGSIVANELVCFPLV